MSAAVETSSQYPMSEKLASVADQSQRLGEFIEWLESKGMTISEYVRYEGYSELRLEPVSTGVERLLADYFEIDLNEVEKERRRILAELNS